MLNLKYHAKRNGRNEHNLILDNDESDSKDDGEIKKTKVTLGCRIF